MEIQDFSPSARNDSCLSHLRLEMTGVSLALQAPCPSPTLGEGQLAVGNSAARIVSFKAHLSGRCIAVCKTKGRDRGEQSRLAWLTASRTEAIVSLTSPYLSGRCIAVCKTKGRDRGRAR